MIWAARSLCHIARADSRVSPLPTPFAAAALLDSASPGCALRAGLTNRGADWEVSAALLTDEGRSLLVCTRGHATRTMRCVRWDGEALRELGTHLSRWRSWVGVPCSHATTAFGDVGVAPALLTFFAFLLDRRRPRTHSGDE